MTESILVIDDSAAWLTAAPRTRTAAGAGAWIFKPLLTPQGLSVASRKVAP